MFTLVVYCGAASVACLFLRRNNIFGNLTNNLFLHAVFSLGFLVIARSLTPHFTETLEATGTSYAEPITYMFLILSLMIYSLFIKLNEYMMVIETFDKPTKESRRQGSLVPMISEYFHLAMSFAVPLAAMGFFIYMTLEITDIGSPWSSQEKRVSNIITAGECFIVWFLVYSFLEFLKKDFIVGRLRRKALSLSKNNDVREVCLQNLDGLFEVGKALNRSSYLILQKNRLLRGFSQFVSSDVVEKVLKDEELEPFSENSRAFVFMIDIRNYTEISNRLEPRELVQWLNLYFEILIDHFDEHGLIIDKFIGDGVLGYTVLGDEGDPTSLVNQTTRTLLRLFKKVDKLNEKMGAYNLPQISIGVGAQFGEVIIGLVGSKSKRQYTIVGDPVNQAARFESLCRRYQTDFVISEKIYDYLLDKSKVQFSISEGVVVKGAPTPMNLYIRTAEHLGKSSVA